MDGTNSHGSSQSRSAVLPAKAPPPFPEPRILAARRVQGLVLTPPPPSSSDRGGDDQQEEEKQEKGGGGGGGGGGPLAENWTKVAAGSAFLPTTNLERRASVAGNILIVEADETVAGGGGGPRAFMLQRKIKSTVFGTVRVAYALRNAGSGNSGTVPDGTRSSSSVSVWEVAAVPAIADSDLFLGEAPEYLVAVSIEDRAKVLSAQPTGLLFTTTAQDPRSELSALQMVADGSNSSNFMHVVGTRLIAADDNHVYTVVAPFCKEGSLFDYCVRRGRLREDEARFFFRQILMGLATLQSVELCHRDLNLQNVLLTGRQCIIMNLSCALRIPKDPTTGQPHMIMPQPPCASYPQAVAPELLRNEPFDGYAVDLWAAGVMLFTMLFGAGALFAAPVAEDRKFRMICEGNLRELVRERQASWDAPMTTSSEPPSPEGASSSGVSNSAVDLLQHMLRPDPSARLTLSEVVRHEWVTM